MELKDLRKGNFVLDRGDNIIRIDWFEFRDKLCMDNTINVEGVVHRLHPFTEDIQYAKPIKLSDEWFERLGFQKDRNGNWWKGWVTGYLEFIAGGDGYYYPQVGQSPEMSFQKEQIVALCRIKYVHELQNLWYWIAREELVYTENK
jgi:hypothetical protein